MVPRALVDFDVDHVVHLVRVYLSGGVDDTFSLVKVKLRGDYRYVVFRKEVCGRLSIADNMHGGKTHYVDVSDMRDMETQVYDRLYGMGGHITEVKTKVEHTREHYNREDLVQCIDRQLARTVEIKKELMEAAWHPSRMMNWCLDTDEHQSICRLE